jgi:hypothetical protein
MTVVTSAQAGQLFAQQQQAMQMSMGAGMAPIPSLASGSVSKGIASTVMGGMQHLPGALTTVGTAGALAAGASGAFGLSGGGAAIGGGLGMLLGGPAGMIGGAAMGALPAFPVLAGMAAVGFGAYGLGQMQQGMGQANTMQQSLGGYNFVNPGSASGRGFSQGQSGQITGMMRSMGAGIGAGGFSELAQAAAALPEMGLMQGVRDAEEFQKKFRSLMSTVKSMTTVLGVSMQEALPFFQGLRSSGFYNQQDIVSQSVNRQLAGSVGISGPQFMGSMNQGAAIAQSYGARRSAGASLNQSVAMGIGLGVQEGILNEDLVTEAAGGRMGGEAYTFLADRMTQQTMQFTTGTKGRKMLRALGEIKDGRYTGGIDRGQLTRWRTGEIGMDNLGGDRGGSDKSFKAMQPRLRGAAAAAMGTDIIGEMVESSLGDKDLTGVERDDAISALMQKYTRLGQAEAELYTDMARSSKDLSRKRHIRASQVVDRQLSEAQLRRTGLGALFSKHVGAPLSSSIKQPFQHMGQILGGNIERETQGFFDSVYGRYTQNVTQESRDAFQWGMGMEFGGAGGTGSIGGMNYGTAGGVAGAWGGAAAGALIGGGLGLGVGMMVGPIGAGAGALAGAGIGAVAGGIAGGIGGRNVGMGGTDAYRSDLRAARRSYGGEVPIAVLERIEGMEGRRAGMGGGLTAADVGISASELSTGSQGMMGALVMDKGKMNWFSRQQDMGVMNAENLREKLRFTDWGRAHLKGKSASQQREVVRAMSQQAGIDLHGEGYANAVGRGLARGRKGALEDLMGSGTGLLSSKAHAADLRAVLSGSSGMKASAFLGRADSTEAKLKKLQDYVGLKQRGNARTDDENITLAQLEAEIGDVGLRGAASLANALQRYDGKELRDNAQAYYVAQNEEGAAVFAAGANKLGGALKAQISSAGEAYATLPPEAQAALEGWAAGLSNMDTEQAMMIMGGEGTGSGVTSESLASAMAGMTDKQRGQVAKILGGMGDAGTQMYAAIRLREKGGAAFKGVSGKGRAMRSALESRSGLGAGTLDSLMSGVERLGSSAGDEAKEAVRLIKAAESSGTISDADATSLVDTLSTAVERGMISGTAAGGKKSGSMAGDLVDLSVSMKDAMTANRLFVQAVSDALPELASMEDLTTKYNSEPAEA